MDRSLVQTVADRIARRLREARRHAGQTLGDVARATDLSEGFLSRVERGQAACSIANLIQICAALEVNVEDLFTGGETEYRTRMKVHRAGDEAAVEVESTGYRFLHLAGGRPRDDLEAFHLVFPVSHGMETMVSHPGQEHCYVLSGMIAFVVAGETVLLGEGDGILIDSSQPHLARNVGKASAHVLMIVSHTGSTENPREWWRVARTE